LNPDSTLDNLVQQLLQDSTHLDLLMQFGVIIVAMGLGWLCMRNLVSRLQPSTRETWGADEWKRFGVPLIAQLLVIAARPVVGGWQSVHLLNLAQPLLLSMTVIQFTFFLLRSIFQPGPSLKSLERVVSWLVWGIVALHITGHLSTLLGALDAIGFNLGKGRISLYSALVGAISIAVTLVIALSLSRLIESRLMHAASLTANIRVALGKFTKTVLIVLAVLIVLPIVGIDLTVLSVFGGALGVGLGFGLQKIASNYISGFTLLLDNSIRIGDMVTVDGRFGEVREIATRFTVIRSRDGTEYILPNETLVTSPVVNHTLASSDNRVGLPIQVAYDTNLERAREIMLAAADKHPRVIKEQPTRVLLTGFGDNGINMELRIWITDPEEGLGRLRSDLYWEIWEGFKGAGIEIPYPQRVIHTAPIHGLGEV